MFGLTVSYSCEYIEKAYSHPFHPDSHYRDALLQLDHLAFT